MRFSAIYTLLLPSLVLSSPVKSKEDIEASEVELDRRDNDTSIFHLLANSTMQDYFNNNRYFVNTIEQESGNLVFELNAKGQHPHTFWIGCADSRAGELCLATLPGEIFTHRNIANVVDPEDMSLQGALQYAVDVLKVKKIVVCGHTECGGVKAALSNKLVGGVLDNWLNPIRQTRAANNALLQLLNNTKAQTTKLAELNVIASVFNVRRHPSALNAIKNGELEVWGMMYDVATGFLSEVKVPSDDYAALFQMSANTAGGH